jgi:hypothetical protein
MGELEDTKKAEASARVSKMPHYQMEQFKQDRRETEGKIEKGSDTGGYFGTGGDLGRPRLFPAAVRRHEGLGHREGIDSARKT